MIKSFCFCLLAVCVAFVTGCSEDSDPTNNPTYTETDVTEEFLGEVGNTTYKMGSRELKFFARNTLKIKSSVEVDYMYAGLTVWRYCEVTFIAEDLKVIKIDEPGASPYYKMKYIIADIELRDSDANNVNCQDGLEKVKMDEVPEQVTRTLCSYDVTAIKRFCDDDDNRYIDDNWTQK